MHFLTVLKARSPRSRCQQIWFLLRALFLDFRWSPSHHILTWPFLCAHPPEWKKASSLVSLVIKTLILLDWGSTLMILFNLKYSLKPPLPNRTMLGIRSSTYKFSGDTNIQSITCGNESRAGFCCTFLLSVLNFSNL